MKKDAFYFPHESNARTDPRILKLRRLGRGWEGYGAYFAFIEILRDQNGYELPEDQVEDCLFGNGIPEDLVKIMIECGLLIKEGGKIYSASLKRRMAPMDEKRSKCKHSASKGGKASQANAQANTQANAQANAQAVAQVSRVEYSRLDKIKEKDSSSRSDSGEISEPGKNKKKKILVSPEEIQKLKTNPGFKGLDIEAEYHRMVAWCDAHEGKEPTSKLFNFWLNKAIEKGAAKKTSSGSGPDFQGDEWSTDDPDSGNRF